MSAAFERSAPSATRDAASFRDLAGCVLQRDGAIYRQIDASFADRWESVVASGLLERLQAAGLLVGHTLAPIDFAFEPATVPPSSSPTRSSSSPVPTSGRPDG